MSKPAKNAPADDAPKKSNKLLFIIIGLVVALAGGGAGAWFALKPGGDTAQAEKEKEQPKEPIFVPLETFTVNLAGGTHYLQTDITLQFHDQAQVDLVKLHMPRVRSRLLTLLSSQHPDALQTEEDKKKLTQAILAAVNQPMVPKGDPQEAVDVLFTSFIIQ